MTTRVNLELDMDVTRRGGGLDLYEVPTDEPVVLHEARIQFDERLQRGRLTGWVESL